MFRVLVVLLLTAAGFQVAAVDADFNGEYRFRVSSDSSTGGDVVDQLGKSLSSEIRAKVSGSFRPSESFEGVAGLYANWDNNNIHRLLESQMVAYGDWMISDEFMLRVGQSTYKIADGSVLGMNDYDAVPSLFKGLFLTHSSENVGLDAALIHNNQTADLLVVSVDARSFPDLVKTANFHFIIKEVRDTLDMGGSSKPSLQEMAKMAADAAAGADQQFSEAEQDNSKGIYLGATLGGGANNFGYKVTASTDSLTNVLGLSNLLVDGKVSYSFEMDNSNVKVHLGGHKDGANYDTLLYEKHYNAGKMDRVVWGNGLTYAYGGLSYRTSADWKVGLKGYYFLESNDSNRVAEGDAEVDVYLKKAFNSSVSGKVWVGAWVPTAASDVDVSAQAVIQMKF